MPANPCRDCGACCAAFRVSFYWAEAAERGLPDELIEAVTPHIAAMRGTNTAQPHCGALEGRMGAEVRCSVYASRPSPCREVEPGDERCARARARYGLTPLPLNRA